MDQREGGRRRRVTSNLDDEGRRRRVTFGGTGWSVRFDKTAGTLQQYRVGTTTLLERGPLPDFWRAPTNNDRGAWKVMRVRRGQ